MTTPSFPARAATIACAVAIGLAAAAVCGCEAAALWRAGSATDGLGLRLAPGLLSLGVAAGAACVLVWRVCAGRMKAAEARAGRLCARDPLLDVLNRSAFAAELDEAVAAARAGAKRFALLALDLDRFKEINGAYGHAAGDQLLLALVQRLSGALRPGDTLARLGDDEFAVLSRCLAERRDGEALASHLLSQFDRPFVVGDRPIHVTASIGVAVAPDDAGDRAMWMRMADEALARAKRDGRNRYAVFEPQGGDESRLRRAIESDLRAAILEERLEVAYQPIFDAGSREIVCVEALLRWRHERLGAIRPDLIVAVAEEKGLVPLLGQWVLRKACAAAASWPRARVAVNVSPIQFRQADFVAQVAKALLETGFDPNRLELELTEGVVVAEADLAERAMTSLRAMGVRMALDDFGIGYSSLIYLRRFPFDKIKIDRSFLESLEPKGESLVLLESIVRLGQALGLTVTAEGVETREQLRLLQRLECDELQGFLLAKPATAAEIGAMLAGAVERQDAERLAVA